MDYDAPSGYYVYYWTEMVNGQYAPMFSRTKDFETYTRAAEYFSPGFSARDLHVFKVSNNNYIGLFTDPDNQGLCTAIAHSVNPARSKFQSIKKVFTNPHIVLSPAVLPAFDGKGWFLFGVEQNTKVIYRAATATASNISWHLYDTVLSGVPADSDGGKVLVISRDELARLTQLIDDPHTGVNAITHRCEGQHTYVYNLKGQRVSDTQPKGVYIIDGKKVVK